MKSKKIAKNVICMNTGIEVDVAFNPEEKAVKMLVKTE